MNKIWVFLHFLYITPNNFLSSHHFNYVIESTLKSLFLATTYFSYISENTENAI